MKSKSVRSPLTIPLRATLLAVAILGTMVIASRHAQAKGDDDAQDLEQIDESNGISQLIRSNVGPYWKYMRSSADLSALNAYMKYEGVVTGDPHLGNFGVLKVRTDNGRAALRFLLDDFDDAGHGPLVLDFVRLEVAAEAANSEVKKRELEEAYIAGLQGQVTSPPPEVRGYLSMSVAEYDKRAADLTNDHTEGDHFRLKVGKTEAYRGPISREMAAQAIGVSQVLDLVKRPIERGGSKGSLKLWALVDSDNGKRKIIELKEYKKPALAFFENQPPNESWLRDVHAAYWSGIDPEAYRLVEIGGQGYFWIREKRVPLIDVPYSSQKDKKVRFLRELANFDANALGLAHGRQAGGDAYAAKIARDPNAFHEATQKLVKDYLASVERSIP